MLLIRNKSHETKTIIIKLQLLPIRAELVIFLLGTFQDLNLQTQYEKAELALLTFRELSKSVGLVFRSSFGMELEEF